MIPLLHTEPIPEYMELLDQLQLSQERSVDYLVGVWVLTKGKLVPPPQPAAPISPPAPAIQQVSTALVPNIDPAQLRQLGITLPPSQTLPSFQSQPPVGSSMPPPSASASAPAAPLPISFDPSQIQLMLQALTGGTQQAGVFPHPPPPTTAMSPQSVSIPHPIASSASQPITLPTAALQPWTANQPPYPPSGSPPYQQQPPPLNYPPQGSPPGPHGPYGGGDRHERERPYQNNGGYEYDRGFRGRGRGRSGDRGRGRDQGWQRGGPRGRGPPPSGPRNRGGGGGGWHDDQRWN